MVEALLNAMKPFDLPPFIYDLARLEWAACQVAMEKEAIPELEGRSEVNPTLELLQVGWAGLPDLLKGEQADAVPGEVYVGVFKAYGEQLVRVLELSGHDLLATKIIAERLDVRDVAEAGGISIDMVENILAEARLKGLVYLPPSRLQRESIQPGEECSPQAGTLAEVFTLQWHLTQKCDLNCLHCYDRSGREEMTLAQADMVLDQLHAFCSNHRVTGQVSFSGGNPLLYKHFDHVYREAADRGFMTAILGNPTQREQLEKIITIRRPEFFQVSLEGMEEHNDFIRGKGHFNRTLHFLDLLKELGIYSMVMLTLTRDNMNEVLPLADFLRDKVDIFNFNRLSPFGEGAALQTVPKEIYPGFLEEYMRAAADNPVMGLKDNLFNIIRDREGIPLTGGCTGFGCGAAFNFISLLPDGEVHACRKFPSLIGNVHSSTLEDIYHSEIARKYRNCATNCSSCRIQRFCRGCPAVIQGSGGEPFTDIDPYCFSMADKSRWEDKQNRCL